MVQKLLTLYSIINEDGAMTYRLSDSAPIEATVLATYNTIYEHVDFNLIPDQNGVVTLGDGDINGLLGSTGTQYYTRTLSDEGRERISESSSKAQKGKGNSQFGTRWIHSLKKKKSKKIRATDPLPDGWNEGRKIKFNKD